MRAAYCSTLQRGQISSSRSDCGAVEKCAEDQWRQSVRSDNWYVDLLWRECFIDMCNVYLEPLLRQAVDKGHSGTSAGKAIEQSS